MRILLIYNSRETYTQTVFEHVDSFQKFSEHEWHYVDFADVAKIKNLLSNYNVIFIHYSVRLPLGNIDNEVGELLQKFSGPKGLFIQDEYEGFNLTKYWIQKINFTLIFTAVPNKSISLIYPRTEFPTQRFINNLTGYAPSNLNSEFNLKRILPPSKRKLIIGYRGRELSIYYGKLGADKLRIGKDVKGFCRLHNISHDIEWSEQSRIYGDKWYQFLLSAKSMLGTESGSNVFDWNGDLQNRIKAYKTQYPHSSDQKIYNDLIRPIEHDGLMNQLSPRIFEMAAACTIMILYEGQFSDIIKPNVHYFSLKKNLSNLPQIITKLGNDELVDEMALKTRADLIDSQKYSYSSFIKIVDREINELFKISSHVGMQPTHIATREIKAAPTRAKPPIFTGKSSYATKVIHKTVRGLWNKLPVPMKKVVKKILIRG